MSSSSLHHRDDYHHGDIPISPAPKISTSSKRDRYSLSNMLRRSSSTRSEKSVPDEANKENMKQSSKPFSNRNQTPPSTTPSKIRMHIFPLQKEIIPSLSKCPDEKLPDGRTKIDVLRDQRQAYCVIKSIRSSSEKNRINSKNLTAA
mmetsp:Transcript_16579/g.16674  ORF Transcript_16579/g.16674 Transcript_16579/m.16674 type:complete len:147 (-) Transcript_16579:354-794(-)